MKRIVTLLAFCLLATAIEAQWSDTHNNFYDSLDMTVSEATYSQINPMVIKSESDGGYFVIWEDYRADPNVADIYAQKYDKDGHRLWAENGVPVATGTTDQKYSFPVSSGSLSFRKNSYAAGDGAGGFYIAYNDNISISPYGYYRVCVQHILNSGTRVFGDIGYVIGDPGKTLGNYTRPQLIADGNGGFFIGYLTNSFVMVYCYKDEGGTLKSYGGGAMNECYNYWAYGGTYRFCQQSGIGGYTQSPTAVGNASEFKIFSDGQNGCGVAMAEAVNTQMCFPAYNRLYRQNKNDNVALRYPASDTAQNVDCADGSCGNCTATLQLYTVNSQGFTNLLGNVFDNIHPGSGEFADSVLAFGVDNVDGGVMTTGDNTKVCLITWNQRDLIASNTVGDYYTRSIAFYIDDATKPALVNDTIIKANPAYDYAYSLAVSGNRAMLATEPLTPHAGTGNTYPIYYQELKLNHNGNSYDISINTQDKNGIVLGFGGSNGYPVPRIAGDGNGNALFYLSQYHSWVQASPLGEGGKLWWGNLGAPLSPDRWNGSYTYPGAPFAYMDADGKAVIAWNDERQQADGTYSSDNIYMRHLDSLLKPVYYPPLRVQLLGNSTYYANRSTQVNINGASNAWTTFQALVYVGNGGGSDYAPMALIKDDYDLGTVSVSAQDNIGAIRTDANGHPYLNRNYTITVTNHPAGANIHVRLIFTKAEFDSLRAHDASIQDPGDLAVIKQPSDPNNPNAPATYTPSANDQGIQPIGWGAIQNTVNGEEVTTGYYIEIVVSDFSNFFIETQQMVLPITLVSFTANAAGLTSLLQWQTGSETNNSHFDIQRSSDGKNFATIGQVEGHGTTTVPQDYRFTDAAPLSGVNYYRLAQVDYDGKATLSAIRTVNFAGEKGSLQAYPNPVHTLLHLRLPAPFIGGPVELYDVNGRKVLQQSVPAGAITQEVGFDTLLPGIYLLRYNGQTVKVVKQ